MFMDALKSRGLTPSDSWGFQPVQRFGTYEFTDPKQAAEFMGSRNFTDFWGRGAVDPSDVAARVEYQTRGRYATSILKETAADEIAKANAGLQRRLAPNSLVSREDAINAYNFATTGTRAEGRFYTPVEEGVLKDYLNYGLNKKEGFIPIRVIADERVSRSRLQGERFGGWTSAEGTGTHQAGMGAEGNRRNLTRVGGRNLGLALSSNPQGEAFVPSNMARPASQGGSSRVAGRLTEAGKIVLQGMPKAGSVPLQVLGNINRVGGAVAERFSAPVALGMMAYGATRDNYLDREFGHTDQFGLRPAWDFMGKITGMYEDSNSNKGNSIPQAWSEMKAQVADPDWIERNQISAVPYNMVLNTGDFVQGLKDAYNPLWQKAANTPSEVSTFVGF